MKPLSLLSVLFIAACAPVADTVTRAATTSDALPDLRSFGQMRATPPTRSNTDMAQDFLDLTFQMENGAVVPVMTRFDGPISVRVEGAAPATLGSDLRLLIERLQSEAGLDIFQTSAPIASITVQVIPRADVTAAVPRAACFVVPRVSNWTEYLGARQTDALDWTTLARRERAAIFIPADAAPQEIRDCLHEELAQALGPLNDLYRLPDSVFNDDNIHSVLTGFDMLMLRAYYDPELGNGMRRDEVATRLTQVIERLNPRGQGIGTTRPEATSANWKRAISTSLDRAQSDTRRRQAAEQAVVIATQANWSDTRTGFAQYALGRSLVQSNPTAALTAFQNARAQYQRDPATQIHDAHVAVQLAAFSLSAGDAETTLQITGQAIPVARAHQNAALLATLLMFSSEALLLSGRSSEAAEVRLDSLSWARYGFGTEREAQDRLSDISDLRPNSGS